MTPYPYKTLDSSRRQIRLITIYPALDEAEIITGKLTYHFLDDYPVYKALSYTWNHQNIVTPIKIDGIDFDIGPNLAAALRQRRHQTKSRTLWIDAICVDQNNMNERREQVQLMRQIFSSAKKVVAWLGKATDDSELALNVLANLEEEDIVRMAREGFRCKRWIALKNLWSRDFWKRIWIVQELVLGNGRVILQCGSKRITRQSLERVYHIFKQHLDNPLTLLWEGLDCNMDWFMNLMAMCSGYDEAKISPSQGQQLEELLDFSGHFHATDARDHVYALLGLSQDAGRTTIEPDYSKSLSQVCAHTVKELVHNKRTIMILYGNRSTRIPGLSSWMPTFGDPVRRGYGWRKGFQASGCDWVPFVEISPCSTLLKLKGTVVDYIDTVEGPFENKRSAFQDDKVLARIEDMTKNAFSRTHHNSNKTGHNHHLWPLIRTLIGNIDAASGSSAKRNLCYLQRQVENMPHPMDWSQLCQRHIKHLAPLLHGMVITLRYRCFFTTVHGHIGVGPHDTKPGDLCAIFLGGGVPFVLRGEGKEQVLVGDCYIDGIMHGELMRGAETDVPREERLFVLH